MTHPSVPTAGMPRASLDRVLNAARSLGLVVSSAKGREAKFQCPVHQERTPSAHATWQDRPGQSGATMLYCHGCHAQGADIAEALGLALTDLFDEPLPERPFTGPGSSNRRRRAGTGRGRLGPLPKPIVVRTREPEPEHAWVEVERYPYVDADGTVVQWVIRQECRCTGTKHKNFPQVYVCGGREVKRIPAGIEPVLYRLPQVREAIGSGRVVWVLEGEKDVATAEGLGLVATTNPSGGRSFGAAYAELFDGACVHAVLDRDETGWARGITIHDEVTKAGGRVRLFLPAVTAAKADFTDHVEAGRGLEDLVEVHVAELRAWSAAEKVEAKATHVRTSIEEAHAHLELVTAAERGDRSLDVEDHRKAARRWVLEAGKRLDAVQEEAAAGEGLAVASGTGWAQAAAVSMHEVVAGLAPQVREVHELAEVPVPARLRDLERPVADDSREGATEEAQQSEDPARPGFAVGGQPKDSTYQIIDNKIWQWEPKRGRRDDDDPEEGSFKLVLGLAVQVISREFLETESADLDVDAPVLLGRADDGAAAWLNPPAPRQLSGLVVAYIHPVTGEETHVRVAVDHWKDHSWLDSLPGSPDYDHRKAGLDNIQRAVLAVSPHVEDTVRYRSTGWRREGEHFAYVHARGVIGVGGHRVARTSFPGALSRYNLPDPADDAAALREAFVAHSATMLERLPTRVGAPLLGHTFRAALGHNEWSLALIGPPGSYKTSVAAKAMHHWGELWDHKTPASSMSGNGATLNALRIQLNNAKDTLFWMDDFAPTKSWVEAQKLLEQMARLIHNREAKPRSTRDGQETTEGPGPRASGLMTSEVMPRPGSGAERLLVVPLAKEDIDTALLFPLDDPDSRHGRAMVMATFLQWLGSDLLGKRRRYRAEAAAFRDELVAAGSTQRGASSAAEPLAGWLALTDCLVDRKAITPAEQARLLQVVREGLIAAADAAVDPDLPTRTGARVRELLAYALRTGIANVSDARTGDCPPWPLAGRLGWRRTMLDTHDPMNVRVRNDRMGVQLGWVLHDPDHGRPAELWCDPAALEPVLKTAANTMADSMQIDRNTASRALAEEGILLPDLSEGRTRFTIKRHIPCEDRTPRVTALLLRELLGDLPDADGDDPNTPGPDDDSGGDGGHVDGVGPLGIFPDAPELPAFGDPHRVEDRHSRALASEQAPTSHPDDLLSVGEDDDTSEDTMGLDPAVDRDGLTAIPMGPAVAQAEGHHPGSCLLCGEHCTSWVIDETDSEWRIHHRCWVRSTRQIRESIREAATRRLSSRSPAAPPPAAQGSSQPGDTTASDRGTAERPRPAPQPGPPQTGPAQSGQRAPRKAAATAPRLRAAVAVVDADGIHCGDGSHEPLPEQLAHAGDLAALGDSLNLGTAVTRSRTASGQVWITAAITERLGLDLAQITAAEPRRRDEVMKALTIGQPVVTQAQAQGWTLGGKNESLGRWTRLWRGTQRSTWLAVLPAMDTSADEAPLLADGAAANQLARRLQLFADTLGFPFQMSAQTTGFDLAFDLRYADRDRLFAPHEPCEPAAMNGTEVDHRWSRTPTPEEREHTYLHLYDRSGSYLPAAGMPLGVGEPTHYPDGLDTLDPRLPGYAYIEVPESGDWRMPNPLDPIAGRWAGRMRWVTTPALQVARELGYEPKILEAWVWHEKLNVFEPWYKRLRDAREALMDVDDVHHQAAYAQIKQVYAKTIGMLGSSTFMQGRRGFAPDRRHMIIGKARANVLRRINQIGTDTGRWPVAAVTDTIAYTSNEPDPVKAWPGKPEHLGRKLGQWKPEGTALLEPQLQYLNGEPWAGKDHIVTAEPGAE